MHESAYFVFWCSYEIEIWTSDTHRVGIGIKINMVWLNIFTFIILQHLELVVAAKKRSIFMSHVDITYDKLHRFYGASYLTHVGNVNIAWPVVVWRKKKFSKLNFQ